MDLKSLHLAVSESISRLDFGSIWPGFEPLRFALYDEDKCFFGGKGAFPGAAGETRRPACRLFDQPWKSFLTW